MALLKVFIALLFLSSCSMNLRAKTGVLAFRNFSEPVLLELQDDGLYQRHGSRLKVQLAPRLIVKTASNTNAAEVAALSPDVTRITDLFLMQKERYFLLHFSSQGQALQALKILQQQPLIHLVQPDLQQQKTRAELDAGLGNTLVAQVKINTELPAYIQRVQQQGLWPGRGGEGVTVAVIDDGFFLAHSEFSQLHTKLYYDFSSKKLLGIDSPSTGVSGSHGTKIAGILFAAHNQQLPEGLVPKANFVGINQPDTWTSQTLQSFYIAYLAKADVINCSWHSQWLLEPVQDVVDELSRYGRAGKGTAVIFAAGNEGKLLIPGMHEASIKSAIVVGATNAHGKPLKTSNFGESVDVWMSGEKITSTDASGSYSYFAGTSLSAVIVSGYVALTINSNPLMDLAQIQTQLIKIFE